jgi:DNA-binding response OmpR family regulator
MQHVLIIADHPTGTLIQKYLLHEQYSVDQFNGSGFHGFPEGPYDIVIIDATRCPQDVKHFLADVRTRSRCRSLVLLQSMENEFPAVEIEETISGRVVMSTKPVKLSELARIVRAELGTDGK